MTAFNTRYLIGATVVVAVLAALDQYTKHLVETAIPLGSRISVMPFMDFLHVRNDGVAFSMLSGSSLLVVVTVAIIALMVWMWSNVSVHDRISQAGFALITGGALGNLIDRAMHGHVTDFVALHAGDWAFAIFNLADTFITIGAALLILVELRNWRAGHGKSDDTAQSGD
jgi:signal peptidase II